MKYNYDYISPNENVYKEPKLYSCRRCGTKTVNYYKCTHCWEYGPDVEEEDECSAEVL
jgi:predicted ATP-dependent serine protease